MITFGPTITPLPLKPFGSSIWNMRFGMPTVCACVSVAGWPGPLTPPQTGGSVASTLPSKSRCG